jgi:hypothetical protein
MAAATTDVGRTPEVALGRAGLDARHDADLARLPRAAVSPLAADFGSPSERPPRSTPSPGTSRPHTFALTADLDPERGASR